jgi:formate hydrogenlyase subunit 3/multisubunit Na+/H+ antiporter MnhD subunit
MLTTVLTSGYILWMYKRIFYGVVPETLKNVRDTSGYVIVTMGVLAAFTLILGLYPDMFYKPIISYVDNLYSHTSGIVHLKQKIVSPTIRKVSEQFKENIGNLKEQADLQMKLNTDSMTLLDHTIFLRI